MKIFGLDNFTFVPLGTRCTSSFLINEQFRQREFSLPFDWIDLSISNMIQFIDIDYDKIDSFLDRYFHGLTTDRHPDGTWFPHDIVKEEGKDISVTVEEVKMKFKRRLKRLHDLLGSENNIVFLTCLASEDKGNIFDFVSLAGVINKKRSPEKNFFITVNLENREYINGSHLNLVVNIDKTDMSFDVWKRWEVDIANRIKEYKF